MSDVTQDGPLFRLSWELTTPEDVAIARVLPDALDLATVDAGVTTFIDTLEVDAGTALEWSVTGVDSLAVISITATAADLSIPPTDDARRYLAALMVGARLWKRKDAPLGVAGGGEFGAIMVRSFDPDVQELLSGLRRTSSDLSLQVWPTVDAFRAHVAAGSASTDVELAAHLDAAVLIVKRRCSAGRGIA